MKILVIAGWYKTDRSPNLGLFFSEQAKALRRAGFDVVMIVPGVLGFHDSFDKGAWIYRKEIEDGVTVLYWRIPGLIFHKIPFVFDTIWYLTTRYLYNLVLRDYGAPDIVHAHHALTAGIQAIGLRSKTGFPRIVVTEHSSLFLEETIKKADAKKLGKVVEKADIFICVSDGLKERIKNHLCKETDKLVTIPNMVSSVFFEIPFRTNKLESRRFTFVSCGNLVPVKGYEFLIESFAKAVGHGMKARLVIIGSGWMKKRLAAQAFRLGVSNIIEFTGTLKAMEVAKRLAACDCFCSTSLMETFGIAMCEALACGLPVLATDTAGARSIVQNGRNGYIIPGRDDKVFSEWMERFFRKELAYDPFKLRSDAYTLFSESSFIRSIASVYENCMDSAWNPDASSSDRRI